MCSKKKKKFKCLLYLLSLSSNWQTQSRKLEKLPMLWVDRGSQSAVERTKQTSAQTVNSAECKCGSGFRSLTEPLMEGELVDGGMS